MTPSAEVSLVQQCYAAFGRGDMAGLLAMFHPEITWRTPGPPDLPTAGQRKGHQQVTEFFGTMLQVFDMQRFEPQTFLSDGEHVIVLGEETLVLRASGARSDLRWVHVWVVRDGRVVSFEDYLDTAEAVAALRAAQASV